MILAFEYQLNPRGDAKWRPFALLDSEADLASFGPGEYLIWEAGKTPIDDQPSAPDSMPTTWKGGARRVVVAPKVPPPTVQAPK